MATVNVTALTADRLRTVLQACERLQVDVLALQETRHHDPKLGWARGLGARMGWHSAFSEAPARMASGATGPGGTAVYWRRSLGKATAYRGPTHRSLVVKWPTFAVASAYGPQVAELDWFDGLMQWLRTFQCPTYALGDFNWKNAYENYIHYPCVLIEQPATTSVGTRPTRMIAAPGTKCVDVIFPPGIPHHGLITYAADVEVPPRQLTRLRRTAAYGMRQEAQTIDENLMLQRVNLLAPKMTATEPLLQRWKRWHLRAETCLQYLSETGFATLEKAGERDKGSVPSSKPAALGAAHRQPESVNMRRLRRYSRRLAERLRSGVDGRTGLSDPDLRGWTRLLREGLVIGRPRPSLADAQVSLATAVEKEALRCSNDRAADWRRQFRQWSDALWQASRSTMKPTTVANFNVKDMATDWRKVWCPPPAAAGGVVEPQRPAVAWRAYADEQERRTQQEPAPQSQRPSDPVRQGLRPRSTVDAGWLPSQGDFIRAIANSRGAPGLDGWSTQEAQILLQQAPSIIEELYDTWCETTRLGSGIPSEVSQYIWAWRTVGTPKGDGDEARPLSVASVWVRAWHKALLGCFPAPPDSQWCCRPGTSVIQAAADWLAQTKTHGMELDLSKAFDTLDYEVLREALHDMSLPPCVVETLICAWSSPRHCQVHGELAEAILPSRGVPQGCPCSPMALVAILSVWCPLALHWLYMDDRTLATHEQGADAGQQLDTALEYTTRFDKAVGVEENASKRQRWGPGQIARIEHLGLSVCPAAPSKAIMPRRGWQSILGVIGRLGTLPGSAPVRQRLAAAFVLPHFCWAAPLMWPPPPICAKHLMRAILRTRTTWYCRGRWWAERVHLHPAFAAGLKAFKPLTRSLPSSAHLEASLHAHAATFGLRVASFCADRGALLSANPADDPRVLAAVTEASCHGDAPLTFQADTDGGLHALRVVGRVRLLHTATPSRKDAEGMDLVDVEAQSDKRWKRWAGSLGPEDERRLRLWRAGAVGTPTRHQNRPGYSPTCKFCGHDLASARHLWQECPRFDALRGELSLEHHVHPSWWQQQPRVTSKSGWITTTAHEEPRMRPGLQIMACKLAIRVVEAVHDALSE